jgi:hypothetical protein
MLRRLALTAFVLVSLTAVPAAAGDGPMPYAMEGGPGVLFLPGIDPQSGPVRYVAVGTGGNDRTALEVVQANGGRVLSSADFAGAWGVPVTTYAEQQGTGISADGRTLVLENVVNTYPIAESHFLVVNAKSLEIERSIDFKGDFAFDALSPDGTRLYLIQHTNPNDTTHYVVRGYDVVAGRLLPGRIADRTQKSWVMQGYPMARATSADGRMVYTLYQNPGGFPFVHALDTERGVAHCVGLPWTGSQNGFFNLRLTLRNHDRTLAVHWLSGRPQYAVDIATWHVAGDHRGGFPRLWAGLGAGGAALVAALAAFLLRRRSREEFEQELVDLLRHAEREVVV